MKYWPAIVLLLLAGACEQNGQVPIDNIEQPPTVTTADSAYLGVYHSLDGKWKGEFEIFRDAQPGPRVDSLLDHPDPAMLNLPNIFSAQVIKVRQEYESLSPFFQRVTIQDLYPETGTTVTSEGVNKVQDGQMWCVVRKPEETVIHAGKTDGPETIIWQRHEQNPQKIEYFRETVTPQRYTIIGWGYYEGSDTTRMPPYWFYGVYQRVD